MEIKTEFITVYVVGAAGYEGIAAQIIETDSETLLKPIIFLD